MLDHVTMLQLKTSTKAKIWNYCVGLDLNRLCIALRGNAVSIFSSPVKACGAWGALIKNTSLSFCKKSLLEGDQCLDLIGPAYSQELFLSWNTIEWNFKISDSDTTILSQ